MRMVIAVLALGCGAWVTRSAIMPRDEGLPFPILPVRHSRACHISMTSKQPFALFRGEGSRFGLFFTPSSAWPGSNSLEALPLVHT